MQSNKENIARAHGHPGVVVGEWNAVTSSSLSSRAQSYIDAQLDAYQGAWGWYFWSLKVEEGDSHAPLGGWSFEALVAAGVTFSPREGILNFVGNSVDDNLYIGDRWQDQMGPHLFSKQGNAFTLLLVSFPRFPTCLPVVFV